MLHSRSPGVERGAYNSARALIRSGSSPECRGGLPRWASRSIAAYRGFAGSRSVSGSPGGPLRRNRSTVSPGRTGIVEAAFSGSASRANCSPPLISAAPGRIAASTGRFVKRSSAFASGVFRGSGRSGGAGAGTTCAGRAESASGSDPVSPSWISGNAAGTFDLDAVVRILVNEVGKRDWLSGSNAVRIACPSSRTGISPVSLGRIADTAAAQITETATSLHAIMGKARCRVRRRRRSQPRLPKRRRGPASFVSRVRRARICAAT